ncbi:MAG: hypothetical protein E6J23_09390 [Chloroflexi bacterium]|nr:MAG: hypothetical protein E6J23_09390 [Chloroflexota bacterium]
MVKGTDADQQNFVTRWLGLFTPQSGSLKAWERVQESATPALDPNLPLEQALAQRYWRQYPPALRPAEFQNMTPGTPRADTGLAAVIPYLGTPGELANLDGVGVPEGDPNYQRNPILLAAQTIGQRDLAWRKGGVIEPPSATLGSGPDAIRLDPVSAQAYIRLVGQMRDRYVGAEVFSSRFQNATVKQQEQLFDAALTKADNQAKTQFFAKGVVDGTDPAMVAAQAVAGFKAQQTLKDRAYWIALLDRAGKLTPEITRAIDTLKETLPDQKEYITVAEYRTAAPRVHEFLSHVPYGTDAHPIGTPADWQAVEAARAQYNLRTDQLVRSGVRPNIADHTAQVETAKALTTIQRAIFLQGALVENPERRRLAQTYGTMLTRFLGTSPQYTRESEAQYRNFPFGQ